MGDAVLLGAFRFTTWSLLQIQTGLFYRFFLSSWKLHWLCWDQEVWICKTISLECEWGALWQEWKSQSSSHTLFLNLNGPPVSECFHAKPQKKIFCKGGQGYKKKKKIINNKQPTTVLMLLLVSRSVTLQGLDSALSPISLPLWNAMNPVMNFPTSVLTSVPLT